MDAHQKILDGKRERIDDTKASHRKSLKKIESDEAKLNRRREAHLAQETKLLERAKVPPRDPNATLVGEPERRGGRR